MTACLSGGYTYLYIIRSIRFICCRLVLARSVLAGGGIVFLPAQVVFDPGIAPPVVGGKAESYGTGHNDDEGEAPRQDVGGDESVAVVERMLMFILLAFF